MWPWPRGHHRIIIADSAYRSKTVKSNLSRVVLFHGDFSTGEEKGNAGGMASSEGLEAGQEKQLSKKTFKFSIGGDDVNTSPWPCGHHRIIIADNAYRSKTVKSTLSRVVLFHGRFFYGRTKKGTREVWRKAGNWKRDRRNSYSKHKNI